MTADAEEVQVRAECPIVRTHHRFLLRQLEFSQQYALMYRCRLQAQQARVLQSLKHAVAADTTGEPRARALPLTRVLELVPGTPSLCIGVLFKQMKLLPGFLEEYQRELVRIDAGDDNEDGGGGALEEAIEAVGDDAATQAAKAAASEDDNRIETRAAEDEGFNICSALDELMLEDSSGRVLLKGLDPVFFCTGVLVGVYGTLLTDGTLQVHQYVLNGLAELSVPRVLRASTPRTPCYIAYVCGLNLTIPDGSAEFTRARTLLELLIDFIGGNLSDPSLRLKSQRTSRLVIGGNSIAPTEELKLRKKVKLDPSDHVRLNDGKAGTGVVTSAMLMKELDKVLERLAASVEVELMPGENDMSNVFQPQQPVHPVLLPNAARYSTLRLVPNPFEFTTHADAASSPGGVTSATDDGGVRTFVVSGQAVNDVARETQFASRLDTIGMMVASGCACPTAPNTLFSFPFKDTDPFVFPALPHCFVACDQPRYETRCVSAAQLDVETRSHTEGRSGSQKMAAEGANEEVKSEARVRLVCVPSFARTGALVLVDVNSPVLHTEVINFLLP